MLEREIPSVGSTVPTEAQPRHELKWQLVPYFTSLKSYLEPGHVIDGIGSLQEFDRVERQAYLTLFQIAHPGEEVPYTLDIKVKEEALSDLMRPEGFNGNVANGTATILPFDAALATEYDPAFKVSQENIENGETAALRVIYQGDLVRGLNRVKIGSILQDVAYFYDFTKVYLPEVDRLQRVPGPTLWVNTGNEIGKRIVPLVRPAALVAAGGIQVVNRMRAGAGVPV